MENWEIITPIYRDYTYSWHERIFAPRGYLDAYDFTHGDYDASAEVDEVWSSIEEHEDGVITELSIENIAILKAEKEEYFGYSKEFLEWRTFWWQAFSKEHYQYLSERFGLEQADMEFDFENHYYLISYGRPVKKLYSDSTRMYADTVRERVPGAKTEWDEETPYESGVVYIYETDKVALVDIEWY